MNNKQLTALTIGTVSYPIGIVLLLLSVSWGPLLWLLIIPSSVYLLLSES